MIDKKKDKTKKEEANRLRAEIKKQHKLHYEFLEDKDFMGRLYRYAARIEEVHPKCAISKILAGMAVGHENEHDIPEGETLLVTFSMVELDLGEGFGTLSWRPESKLPMVDKIKGFEDYIGTEGDSIK